MNPAEIINTHKLSWNGRNDCVFEATVTNNSVSALHFCEPPAKTGEERICLTSTDEHFLRQTAEYLNELFAYVDKERSKTGTFKLDEITEAP